MKFRKAVFLFSLVFIATSFVISKDKKPRIFISTDIGGDDPDDYQSMVHLLIYADMFNIEGIISSPPGAGRSSHILECIDKYELDYPKLSSKSSEYPSPAYLRSVTKQGATDPQQNEVPPVSISEGAQFIIERANASATDPLYVLVWGSITDVAQAVYKDPEIKKKIRIYSIGSRNTMKDTKASDYLYYNHKDLWWIESNTSFRGMYLGGEQKEEYSNTGFVTKNIKDHGHLGDLFYQKKIDIKMGDTPSVLYMLNGDPSDPTSESWGGAFRADTHSVTYWTDKDEEILKEGQFKRAKTVNKWRKQYLDNWKERMKRIK